MAEGMAPVELKPPDITLITVCLTLISSFAYKPGRIILLF